MDGKLVSETDPILRNRCNEWDFSNPPHDSSLLVLNMINVMREARGMGLSANQIGINTRVFVMEKDSVVGAYFNPEIVNASEQIDRAYEGCLSFPDLYLNVKRPISVSVRYQNMQGEVVEEQLEGVNARCFVHELDHLNGITFTTKVSKLQLDMSKKKRDKLKG